VRPTGDRLKESLFNILGPSIRDARFLDVFAGTGAIGLEALSRGANEVVFIESSTAGNRLIRANLQLCGVTAGFQLLNYDVFKALRFLSRTGSGFATVFLDPPYEWRPYRDLLEIVFRSGLTTPNASVVVEHHRKAVLPELEPGYHRTRIVQQSDKCLSFYRGQSPNYFGP
jgi:16S rRNA (guanine(966)-N(2))-methyltransferase RsmD